MTTSDDTNIMDTWLVENDHKVRVNLGESNVSDLRLCDVLPRADDQNWLHDLTLGNNSTWGSLKLRQAVADTYPGISSTNVLVTAGVSEAVVVACLTHYEPGANFIIPVPAFHSLFDVPEKLGYEIRKISLRQESEFRLCTDSIIEAIDAKTRIILLNSPHNPTGIVYSHDDIAKIARAANEVGALVIVDEHYRYLPYDASREWTESSALTQENIVTLGSVGKCFGCTGIRVGWIIASDKLLDRYHHHKLLVTHTIPVISDRIAAELLIRRRDFLPRTRAEIAQNIQRLNIAASRSDGAIRLHVPDAGSIAFVELRDVKNTLAFTQKLLDEFGILVLPGESFDSPGFIRLRLGISPTAFDEACDRIQALLERDKPNRKGAAADGADLHDRMIKAIVT